MSVDVPWATLPNHQRQLRALYQRCAPAVRVEELKRLSQRLRGTRLYPGARKISPRDRDSSRCTARCASGGIRGWSGVLRRGARPIAKDVGPVVLYIPFVFPRRYEESRPVSFVHDGDYTSPAANELMPRDLVDLEAFRRWRNIP